MVGAGFSFGRSTREWVSILAEITAGEGSTDYIREF